jgi:DeoR/GlpR family transcriptional regulator of sugar metabolism
MPSLLKSERHRRILQLIEENGRGTVNELSQMLGVSGSTIRRDLEEMDQHGLIQREHGGAFPPDLASVEPPVLQRSMEQAVEKRRIGRAAAQLVENGMTIFIGSGTTTLEMARYLEGKENLTVITNALNIANQIAGYSGITLIVIGGLFRRTELSLIGHITEQALKELRADKVFFGIRAINMRDGLTNDYLPETMTDRAIIEVASEVILLADHTKFDKVSTARVAPITAVDVIVTDDQLSDAVVMELEEAGVRVIVT